VKNPSAPSIVVVFLASILIFVSFACNFPLKQEQKPSLVFDEQAADGRAAGKAAGSVSGRFRAADDRGSNPLEFNVTPDGYATFHIAGTPESETLTVDLRTENTVTLGWNGVVLDGMGTLSGDEQAALEHLMISEMAHGLELIPLDAGCQVVPELEPRQVAALLVPLQMRFKYQVTDRQAEAERLIALSACDYSGGQVAEGKKVSSVMFSPENPIPVVFGYFPFDAEGAVEAPVASNGGAAGSPHLACLPAAAAQGGDEQNLFRPLVSSVGSEPGIQIDVKGPCGTMCRGACGANCSLSNCTLTTEYRCETDAQGHNTGLETLYRVYECGLHQGCIDHDNCYDRCNETYGCGTFGAGMCRHAWTTDPLLIAAHPDWWCDQKAVGAHGWVFSGLWMEGYGPQPLSETFVYPSPTYVNQPNADRCPVESQGLQGAIPAGSYTGNFPWNDKAISTLVENEIRVDISASGEVSGSAIFYNNHYTNRKNVEGEDCQTYYEFKETYTIQGQISGWLDQPVHVTVTTLEILDNTACGGELKRRDESCECEALLTVRDGEMLITCGTGVKCTAYLTARK
jgi:hypothetical protein